MPNLQNNGAINQKPRCTWLCPILFLMRPLHVINTGRLANPIRPCRRWRHNLWSSYEYPIQYQNENSCARLVVIKVSPPSSIMFTIEFRMVSI